MNFPKKIIFIYCIYNIKSYFILIKIYSYYWNKKNNSFYENNIYELI